MKPWRLGTGLILGLMLASSSCISSPPGGASRDGPGGREDTPRGGTLRVLIPGHGSGSVLPPGAALDPQTDWWGDSFELFRCCLLRTLLAHPGKPTRDGGSELLPDLAIRFPEVSTDGLTWTFTLKRNIRYAPPLQDHEVAAADIVRALERTAATASPTTYAFYYSVIEGFDAMAAGEADSISGLEAPDPSTLIVHLTRPAGDLANLFTMPATAPIPPDPLDLSKRLGVAQGHDRYGRFLVSTGPYMIEGSEDLDLTVASADRTPLSGYVPRRSITLVRNPSWVSATDGLRPAYVDRIEITVDGSVEQAARMVLDGDADLYLYAGIPPQLPPDMVEGLLDDPERRDQVFVDPRDQVRYITMNLAVPPLDDVHVRKAINIAVDKQALLDLRGGPIVGEVAGHIVLDSLQRGLLSDYDPYETPSHRGDVNAARTEMRLSRYDSDGDGRCDHLSCRDLLLVRATPFVPLRAMAESVRRDLASIGIQLRIRGISWSRVWGVVQDPRSKIPMAMVWSWGKDFLNASSFVTPLFSSDEIGSLNHSLVGAKEEQLRRWGYDVTAVASVDDRIERCLALVGDVQVRCWSEIDQHLMERVVPWVPYVFENLVHVVSDRVIAYSYDQFASVPALDRIAIRDRG